jgi:hypothetical protein
MRRKNARNFHSRCASASTPSSWARSVADLILAIEEARAAGLLAESGTGPGFRHPLIRTALHDEMLHAETSVR